jgi:hypothetical protein
MMQTREDLNLFAGKWTTSESPMYSLLPADCEIIVGSDKPMRKPDDYEMQCWLCKGLVRLSDRDRAVFQEHPKMIPLCPVCYLNMEPEFA